MALPNYTENGTAEEDAAWDTVDFQLLSAKPPMAVQMDDSYSLGKGASDYSAESDRDYGEEHLERVPTQRQLVDPQDDTAGPLLQHRRTEQLFLGVAGLS